MAEIGSRVYIDSWNYFQLNGSEIEVDTPNNRSKVAVWLDLHVAGHVASSGISVGVNEKSVGLGYQYYGAGTHQLIYNEIWVGHNDDGSGTAILSWWFNSNIGNWSGSGALGLTKINRYPILNNGMNFKDTENPTLDITAFNTYPLRVKLEAGGNAGLITRDLINRGSQRYTIELTSQERDLLRSMMTGETLDVRETVCALNNGSEISWSWKDYKMTKGNRGGRILVNGQWKEAIPYVGVNGQWKEAISYVGVNGQWKEGI